MHEYLPVVVADVAGATVRVHLTLSPAALDSVWHGDKARQTPAHRVALSVLHALSVGSTGRGLTRVWSGNTPLTLTHISSLTVWVSGALWSTPGDGVRLGDQSWLTPTDGVTLYRYSSITGFIMITRANKENFH